MSRYLYLFLLLTIIHPRVFAQAASRPAIQPATRPAPKAASRAGTQSIARPKLVVGIVIDQMRWDYLYRYYDRYSPGGFKRLMQNGFNCENTFIPYTPTVT